MLFFYGHKSAFLRLGDAVLGGLSVCIYMYIYYI